jgi:hypothetical protein
MTTTIFVDSGATTLGNVPTFTRVLATESDASTDTAVSLVKRVTDGTTLDNNHGGPGILFSRGYGTSNANDTPFALLGAAYRGTDDLHTFNFNTSTNGSTFSRLLTLSIQNADFNMPVGMQAYANLTAINAIANPVAGMVVYNTATETLYVYSGSQWNDAGVVAQDAYTLPAATTSALGGVIIPAVGTSGITNSSGTIGVATASTTQLGAVKVDGSTITINGSGVVSANTSYTLPTATTSVLGGVKIDGTSITINGSGVITANATTTLDGLTDVTLTSPAQNQLLSYNTATSQWVNRSVISSTGAPDISFERQTTAAAGGATSIFGALALIRRITDATTGYDEGGAGLVFRSVGTSNVVKSNAIIGAYNNTGDVSDFAIKTSNDGGTTFLDTIVTSQSRTNINAGVLFVDKTTGRVGINDTTPEYALDVTGQVRATTGFVGDLTGNASTATNGVVTTGSYADPSWITSLAYSKLTGTPSVTTSLAALTDVTISNAQKGKLLYHNGTEWIDSSAIEFDSTTFRPRFTNNVAPGTVRIDGAAEFLKNTGDAPQQGDGSAILFGTVQTNGTKRLLSRVSSEYRSDEAHRVFIQTSANDFATAPTTVAVFASTGSQIASNLNVTGNLSVTGGNIAGPSAGQGNLFNDSVPDINIGNGATTAVRIGSQSTGAEVLIKAPILVGAMTTQAVFNTVATTVNAFGAATAVNIGAATGVTTIGADLTVAGDLRINGNEIKSSTGATAITLSGDNATVLGDLTVDGALNLYEFIATNATYDAVTVNDAFVLSNDTYSGGATITPYVPVSTLTNTTNQNFTMGLGIQGQTKTIVRTDSGSCAITVTNAGWKPSTLQGTITLGSIGASVNLIHLSGKWYIIGQSGTVTAS